MPLFRDDDGTYRLELDEEEARTPEQWTSGYSEALPRYLTALDAAFVGARQRSEFQYILTLLRVRGVQDAGWDPFETTVAAMDSIRHLAATVTDYGTQRHLHLWTYGHLVEASEPYEIVYNMISVSNGGTFNVSCFPVRGGRPQTPEQKIKQIEALARSVGMPDLSLPLRERWDRDLRNAIFHADYSLYGSEVRIRNPGKSYTSDEFILLLNRAAACHDAIRHLHQAHTESYAEPVLIDVPPEFSQDPDAKGQLIIRKGYGVVGMRAAWPESIDPTGRIRWSLGRYLPGEEALLQQDPTRLILPPVPRGSDRRTQRRPARWCPE